MNKEIQTALTTPHFQGLLTACAHSQEAYDLAKEYIGIDTKIGHKRSFEMTEEDEALQNRQAYIGGYLMVSENEGKF